MSAPSAAFLVHGTATPPAPPIKLRAGPLVLDYDNGDLRGVKLGECEIIRRICGAVRDCNWDTVPGVISDLRFEISDSTFRIRYVSEHRQGDIHFIWHAELTGDAEGTLRFTFDGEAKTTFLRNRIGLCVLHPIRECSGAGTRAMLTDGSALELVFPDVIAAEQPIRGFENLAGLAHEVAPGVWAEVRFTGDVFETEDQRNWIDASFKTYGTPLSLPFPVEVEAGTRIRQNVELRLVDTNVSRRDAVHSDSVEIGNRKSELNESLLTSAPTVRVEVPKDAWVPIPELGLGCSSNQSPENFPNKARLGSLPLSHLRTDVKFANADWGHHLLCASLEASVLKLPLELAIHLPSSGEGHLQDLRMWFSPQMRPFPKQNLNRVLVFSDGQNSTTSAALALVRKHLGDLEVPIGVGTNADLYQLNLQRPPADADFICWTMNPQVHASDTRSLMETPEAAAVQVASVKAYFPGAALVISPITLKPRFNPVANDAGATVLPGELPPTVDPRQMSLVGAAWTVAMLAALAPSGVESLTFFETTGWRGLMETAQDSPQPDRFPSLIGGVFPMWHVFAALNGYRFVSAAIVNESKRVAAFALSNRVGRKRVVLANLTPDSVAAGIASVNGTVRLLDESNVADATREPEAWWKRPALPLTGTMALRAYAVAFVDVTERECPA